jgi:hypothetical protein
MKKTNNGTFKLIKGANHGLLYNNNPNLYESIIQSFMKGVTTYAR